MPHDAAKRIATAASRLLGAAAAYVIRLSFAAGHCKSHWSVICQQLFSILALAIFVLRFLLKSASKSCLFNVFFALALRSSFGGSCSHAAARSSIVFCNSISRYRIVTAASRLLGVETAYVILPTDAACCPDINIEDVVLLNGIGEIAENTAYTQSFLVWDLKF